MYGKKAMLIGLMIVFILSSTIWIGGSNQLENEVYRDGSVVILDASTSIEINNDTDFAQKAAQYGWPGDGSEGNPYVISDLEIDINGTGNGISIKNVTVHFVIRNCTLYNTTDSGIYIYNTQNGVLENNTIHNVSNAVYIDSSSNIIVEDSTLYYLGNDGVHIIGGSTYVDVRNNAIRGQDGTGGSGVYMWDSDNNTVENNTIRDYAYGIFIATSSDYNDVRGNHIFSGTQYGIYIQKTTHNVITYNEVNNTEGATSSNGDGILYQISESSNRAYLTISHNYVHDNTGAGIRVDTVNDGYITISHNTVLNNTRYGIHFYEATSNVEIKNNYVATFTTSGITYYGIYIYELEFNSYIEDNTVEGYPYGIYAVKWFGSSGGVFYNEVNNASTAGIYYYADSDFWYPFITRGNTVSNSGVGIYYAGASGSTSGTEGNISENKIVDCPTGIKVAEPVDNSVTVYGNYIENSSIGGISVGGVGIRVIKNKIVEANQTGIYVGTGSSNVDMGWNKIYNTNKTAIYINEANGIKVYRNHINVSGVNGIALWGTSNSTVSLNAVENTTSYGIYINDTSGNNTILNNSLFFNHGSGSTYSTSTVQGYDSNGTNVWNTSGNPHGYGNFWYEWANNNATNDQNGDYIVDWPYAIDGSTTEDSYPLKNSTKEVLPEPPRNLASTSGYGFVNLSWDVPESMGSGTFQEYRVYRDGSLIATVSSDWYNDTSGDRGITYEYYVTTVTDVGESIDSNHVEDTPRGVPYAVGNLVAMHTTDYVNISWTPPGNDGGAQVISYRIYRDGAYLAEVAASQRYYNDTGVESAHVYRYNVTAVNNYGEGDNASLLTESVTWTLEDSFSTDTGRWDYSKDAYRDSNGYVVLTRAVQSQAGLLWLNSPVSAETFIVNFRYLSSGADGMVFMFYKNRSYAPGGGGGLTFNSGTGDGVAGYGVEIDAYQNNEYSDPSSHHFAIIKDNVSNHLVYRDDSRISDGNWHDMVVWVNATNISVYVDNELVLRWTGTIDRTYDAMGFGGATGGASGRHYIDDVKLYAPLVPTPPRNLRETNGTNYVNLSWDAPLSSGSADITGYNIYRNGTLIATVPASQLWYNDTSVTSGYIYNYTVTAVNSVGESESSNSILVNPGSVVPEFGALLPVLAVLLVGLLWRRRRK